ncbi:MAG: hypothetical protein REI96_22240 [Flavobacterium nitrogenifigens]|uniref:hypothetical protein n=1 Tax=Flavobacterium nitrogenifigens TaxID=1617283 RepID=UPI002809BA95|nr:hypothetical protein [Flavobacterium nitrogenifigens]MDQ8015182.1 hypothetical protein [Flavobacterium nitrogenifigens]
MKIKDFYDRAILTTILLLLAPFKIFSQTEGDKTLLALPPYNLYYLSRYIPTNLEAQQSDQVYDALIACLGTSKANEALQNYHRASAADKTRDFLGAFLDDRTKNIEIKKQEMITNLKSGTFIIYRNMPALEKKYNDYAAGRAKKMKDIDTLQSLEKRIGAYIKLGKKSKELLGRTEDSIKKETIQITDKIKEIKKNDSIEKVLYDKEVVLYVNSLPFYPSGNTAISGNLQSSEQKYSATQIQINSFVQPIEQRAATNSINLPSESDLINAMAIFLAKRAQQEAAIWFMDQLRENMNNPLIFEAFPETLKLIEGLEDYKTPNFSASWRYAISSDFVRMPKNLAASAWVKNLIFEENPEKAAIFSSCVNFSYDLNRLVAEKYSYRDIIRYFYTNPNFDYSSNTSNLQKNNSFQKALNRSVSMLYILTNEFFSIDSVGGEKNFRLLSYEEINSLNENQLIALGQLIKAKYGDRFDQGSAFFAPLFIASNKDKISNWLGNMLLSLSQFDKVNKDFQKALENKNDLSNYSFYNIWQITSQIIDNLDYKNYSFSGPANLSGLPKDFDVSLIKNCIGIYDHMQAKNYSAAIKELTGVIEKISANAISNDFYMQGKKISFKADSFVIVEKGVQKHITLNLSGKKLEIKIDGDPKNSMTIENFIKIQPFMGFVRNAKKDYNYDLITKLDTSFNKRLSVFCDSLKLEKDSKTAFLKALSLYEITDADVNSRQLSLNRNKLASLSTSQHNSDRDSEITNSDLDKAKNKYLDQLFKLTAFFSDILAAKNEQDLANVIDSHALPPTSYKLKRKVRQSIDLNGYVGAQVSKIFPNGKDSSLEKQYTAGITAPIGFAFTWSGRGPKSDNFGFTADIIDLGNIVNHYLVSPAANYPKDVHFSEVFSPAVSGIYSLRKTPFVAFASAKFLPLKASKSETGILVNNKTFDAFILSIGVKIDIPLVNLKTIVD